MLSSDTAAEYELHIDGCPMRLAAILTQRKTGEQCWQMVQYVSRGLTDPEKRYSQIELVVHEPEGVNGTTWGDKE